MAPLPAAKISDIMLKTMGILKASDRMGCETNSYSVAELFGEVFRGFGSILRAVQ